MLRTAGLLALLEEAFVSGHRCWPFDQSSPLSYSAAGTLPRPDFHRQAEHGLSGHTPPSASDPDAPRIDGIRSPCRPQRPERHRGSHLRWVRSDADPGSRWVTWGRWPTCGSERSAEGCLSVVTPAPPQASCPGPRPFPVAEASPQQRRPAPGLPHTSPPPGRSRPSRRSSRPSS
jgi:hypothetical protein